MLTAPAGSPARHTRVMGPLVARVQRFAQVPPVVVDIALTTAIGSLGLVTALHQRERAPALLLVLVAGLVLPLLWRRRAPALTFTVIAFVALGQWVVGPPLVADVSLLVALYTVASRQTIARAALGAAVVEVGVVLAIVQWAGRGPLLTFVLLSGMVAAAVGFGVNSQTRRAYLSELQERAARLERERDTQTQIAAAEERARIARDMHDIVAHHLTVIVALAEGSAAAVARNPDAARTAMFTVSETGRTALSETRQLLGLLRSSATGDAHRPPPALDQLDELIEQMRRTGLPVTLTVAGQARSVPAGIQVAVFRLVQEALTNVIKHAGLGVSAQVHLTNTDTTIRARVVDDGRPRRASDLETRAPGHGLTGMRERVAAVGGELVAGPLREQGWEVCASIPLPVQTART